MTQDLPQTIVVHALNAGQPLCLFMAGQTPSEWPANHRWVSLADAPAFAPESAEPCPVCERLVRERHGCPLLLDDRDEEVVLPPRPNAILVRVRYKRDPNNGGWSFMVLSAVGVLRLLGEGWSAGKRADAESDFEAMARERGWVTK